MSIKTIFHAPTLDKTTIQLANVCPTGKQWGSKYVPNSNTYELIACLAKNFNILQQLIEHLAQEFDINMTSDLLPDWETSTGLPDSCKRNLTTLEQRRQAVITQLQNIPIVTKEEYETLGSSLIDQTVVVQDGWSYDTTHSFPDKYSRFKLYVQFINQNTGFPYAFPFPFGGFRSDLVECVFKKITPAFVQIILV